MQNSRMPPAAGAALPPREAQMRGAAQHTPNHNTTTSGASPPPHSVVLNVYDITNTSSDRINSSIVQLNKFTRDMVRGPCRRPRPLAPFYLFGRETSASKAARPPVFSFSRVGGGGGRELAPRLAQLRPEARWGGGGLGGGLGAGAARLPRRRGVRAARSAGGGAAGARAVVAFTTSGRGPNTKKNCQQNNNAQIGIGGVFHGGVEVHGEEWSYGFCDRGSGVYCCRPKANSMYTLREVSFVLVCLRALAPARDCQPPLPIRRLAPHMLARLNPDRRAVGAAGRDGPGRAASAAGPGRARRRVAGR